MRSSLTRLRKSEEGAQNDAHENRFAWDDFAAWREQSASGLHNRSERRRCHGFIPRSLGVIGSLFDLTFPIEVEGERSNLGIVTKLCHNTPGDDGQRKIGLSFENLSRDHKLLLNYFLGKVSEEILSLSSPDFLPTEQRGLAPLLTRSRSDAVSGLPQFGCVRSVWLHIALCLVRVADTHEVLR